MVVAGDRRAAEHAEVIDTMQYSSCPCISHCNKCLSKASPVFYLIADMARENSIGYRKSENWGISYLEGFQQVAHVFKGTK